MENLLIYETNGKALNNGKPTFYMDNVSLTIRFYDEFGDFEFKNLTMRKLKALIEDEIIVDGSEVYLEVNNDLQSDTDLQNNFEKVEGTVRLIGKDTFVVTEKTNYHLNAELGQFFTGNTKQFYTLEIKGAIN